MPIFEYELNDDEPECQICAGRFEVLQEIGEEALERCPGCGLPCHKVVSRASFSLRGEVSAENAAKKGFTTWRRAKRGEWEKVAGPGVDAIVSPEQHDDSVQDTQVIDLSDND